MNTSTKRNSILSVAIVVCAGIAGYAVYHHSTTSSNGTTKSPSSQTASSSNQATNKGTSSQGSSQGKAASGLGQTTTPASPLPQTASGAYGYLSTVNTIMAPTVESVISMGRDYQYMAEGKGSFTDKDLYYELQADIQSYQNGISQLEATKSAKFSADKKNLLATLRRMEKNLVSMQAAAKKSSKSELAVYDQKIGEELQNLQIAYTADITAMQSYNITPLLGPDMQPNGSPSAGSTGTGSTN